MEPKDLELAAPSALLLPRAHGRNLRNSSGRSETAGRRAYTYRRFEGRGAPLRAGQRVLLPGCVTLPGMLPTKRITEMLDRRENPPELDGAAIYYAGPTPAPEGLPIGSCGPTTSGRMDPYTPRLDLG